MKFPFSIFKKVKKSPDFSLSSFQLLMDIVERSLSGRTEEEQLIVLDYVIDSLKIDICSSAVISPLIQQPSKPLAMPFPLEIFDENGNKVETSGGIIEIQLSETSVYVKPWNNNRTFSNILYLSNKDFIYDSTNHYADYYADINLCYVYNGNHSINAGRYLKKGCIKTNVVNIEKLYQHCYSDGEYWYNTHTKEKICEIDDFRLAAIFEIAKKRYFLKIKKDD